MSFVNPKSYITTHFLKKELGYPTLFTRILHENVELKESAKFLFRLQVKYFPEFVFSSNPTFGMSVNAIESTTEKISY